MDFFNIHNSTFQLHNSSRMQEMADPAISLNRARETWQQHGRSEKWIQQATTYRQTINSPSNLCIRRKNAMIKSLHHSIFQIHNSSRWY